MLKVGQFMDGVAMNESSNKYTYFSSGPDGVTPSRDDLLGRFSMRRYNWEDWSTDTFGSVRDWQKPENQDMVVMDIFKHLFTTYRLQFPDETTTQIYQRLAAWWKGPSYANDPNPKSTWGAGIKGYIRHVGEAINTLGYEGWTTGQGWL